MQPHDLIADDLAPDLRFSITAMPQRPADDTADMPRQLVADELGLSEARVRQIECAALRALRWPTGRDT